MAYRIFMTVRRGITDATAVCVFPWEKQILEEIHGANAQVVSIDQMCSMEGVASVKPIKFTQNPDAKQGPGLREQLEAMVRVSEDRDPFRDLDTEYARLQQTYGMHPDVAIPVVEKVYGSPALFRQAVRKFNRAKPLPPELERATDRAEAEAEDEEALAPSEMSVAQLKKKLDEEGIAYPKKVTRDELIDLVTATV